MKITEDMAGCWLDGHMGWRNHGRVVFLAESYGMKITDDEHELIKNYIRDEETSTSDDSALDRGEAIIGQGGLVDKATDWLNDRVPAGHHFEWDMGELSLIACSEIEGHGPETCDAGEKWGS